MLFSIVFLNCFKKIQDFGNNIFDNIFMPLYNLPGFIKGIVAIIILGLMAIGVLTLLKKSFKIFGIIISVVIIAILVSLLLNK